MLKLSKKVEYSLISLMHMDAMADSSLATAKQISETYQIPSELLGKILQSLARANLLKSVQGSKGGYRLMRRPEEVTLGEVVKAVEGPLRLTACEADPSQCGRYASCNIRKPVYEVQRQLLNYFSHLSLADLKKSATSVPDVVVEGGVHEHPCA